MGIIGDLSKYTQFQAAEAMRVAAETPGGTAGVGVGIGAGMAMGRQMAEAMERSGGSAGPATPPPVPAAAVFYAVLGGQQAGPFSIAELEGRIRGGEFGRDTLLPTNRARLFYGKPGTGDRPADPDAGREHREPG